jgi:AAA15 family ATPase/GTPase
MLIEFRVANYRSVGEEQIISLLPTKSQSGDSRDNILEKGKYNALNALALYGANASGKSNILLSMSLFDKLIHLSARSSSTTKLPYDPFLLREDWHNKPTKFEITFILNEAKYRYGFEFTQDAILSEWLYRKKVGREVYLFLRQGDVIDTTDSFGNSKKVDLAIETTRPNALFLSTCDMLNVEEAKNIFEWFRYFNMIDGLKTEREEIQTVQMWNNPAYQEKIRDYLTRLNIGIQDIDVLTKDFDATELPNNLSENARNTLIQSLTGKQSYTILAKHHVYDKEGNKTNQSLTWKMEERESAGTNKAFHLSGPILWALINGGVLIIDEMESKMHPILTLDTINFFLNKETNPNQAQLIFATHDTNLLTYAALRRDQIYFSEKNKWESTEIFSLSDFVYLGNQKSEKERPDTDKEKRYFEGRYGAIPVFGNFKTLKLEKNGKTR